MTIGDEIRQMKEGTHKLTHLFEALGAVLIVAFVGWMIYSYTTHTAPQPMNEPSGENAAVPPPMTREKLIEQMSEKVPTPPTISPEEKARMLKEMSQQAPTSAGGVAPTDASAPATKAPTAEERAKMLEMMSQQAP